jgi:hypothetical protein
MLRKDNQLMKTLITQLEQRKHVERLEESFHCEIRRVNEYVQRTFAPKDIYDSKINILTCVLGPKIESLTSEIEGIKKDTQENKTRLQSLVNIVESVASAIYIYVKESINSGGATSLHMKLFHINLCNAFNGKPVKVDTPGWTWNTVFDGFKS